MLSSHLRRKHCSERVKTLPGCRSCMMLRGQVGQLTRCSESLTRLIYPCVLSAWEACFRPERSYPAPCDASSLGLNSKKSSLRRNDKPIPSILGENMRRPAQMKPRLTQATALECVAHEALQLAGRLVCACGHLMAWRAAVPSGSLLDQSSALRCVLFF